MGTKLLHLPGYQVLVTLEGVAPAVWRRLTIPGQWHLGRVHDVLQTAMGWTNSHLHEFEVGDQRIGTPHPYGMQDPVGATDVTREAVVRLHEVIPGPGATMTYTYDFGDGWTHDLMVEQLLDPVSRAGCLGGAGACPPEDCGGPGGYAEMLAALDDPAHEGHEHFTEWIGGAFDPSAFDRQATDLAIGRIR